MPSDNSDSRAEGELFIRSIDHRIFVVLRYGDQEIIKGLPMGVHKWTNEQTQRHIRKVLDTLMAVSGVTKVKVADCPDESVH